MEKPKNHKIKFYSIWLILIIIIIFILQQIPNFTDLFVLNKRAIENFEIYRFVTSIFLHGTLLHLLLNLFALLLFGLILEKTISSKNFLIVFFVSGIIANIITVNFYNSSLGASGAIYGILLCIAVLRPMLPVWAFGIIVPMFIAVILWITGDLLRTFGYLDQENIGTIAHLSGALIGLIFGFFYRFKIKNGRIIDRYKNNQKPERIKIPEKFIENWENTYMKR